MLLRYAFDFLSATSSGCSLVNMSFKPNEKHWSIILSYLEKNPRAATGRFSGPNGKQQFSKLWADLSKMLNGLSFGFKSAEKWQKFNLKKKAAEIKKSHNETGSGKGTTKVLNEYELRALQLLGPSFAGGIGSCEVGLSQIDMNDSTSVPCPVPSLVPISSQEKFPESPLEPNIAHILGHTLPLTEKKTCFNTELRTETPFPAKKNKRPIHELEHSYTAQNRVKRKKNDDSYYEETISILKNINKTIDHRLGQIYQVLSDHFQNT